MGVEIKKIFAAKELADKIKAAGERTFSRAVADEVTVMVQRTRAGQDSKGASLKALSPKYAAYKQKKGRNPSPDLTFTGQMLASITHKTTATAGGYEAKIFFSSAKESEKAEYNLKTRPFFELSNEQIERIVSKVRQQLRI